MKGTFYIICCATLLGVECCTFPSILEGKLWEDSAKGKPVTFSGDTMTGWNVSIFNTVMSSWQCLFNQNDIIVSRSSYEQSIPLFSTTTYYVYACMWIVSIDAQTLIYYLLADEITDANTRIYKSTNDSLGACDVCKFSLTLNSADGKAMSTTGAASAVTIPAQSGPCIGCSCTPTTTSTSTIIPDQRPSSRTPLDQGPDTAAIVVPVVLAVCVLFAVCIAVIVLKYQKKNSTTCVEKVKS
ncbi:uncharacterized protein LOC111126644 isoform X2 [Crassostrea virginica]